MNTEAVIPINRITSTREHFDTCCSFNATGNKDRLTDQLTDTSTAFSGFNNSISRSAILGKNPDKLSEYYVPGMDRNTTLLCAQTYAQLGCVVLFKDKGFVLQLTSEEQKVVQKQINMFPITKVLDVENNIYVVNHHGSAQLEMPVVDNIQQARAAVGSRFFQNVKVHTTDQFELILSYLMCGFTIQGLEGIMKTGAVKGINPLLTLKAIQEFRRKHGDRPAMIGRGVVRTIPVHKGLRDTRVVPKNPGDRVEIDIAFPKFNVPKSVDNPTGEKKITSVGGAIGFALAVDAASNFFHVVFIETLKQPVVVIRKFVHRFETEKVPIKLIATDQGMNPESSTMQNAVVRYLDYKNIESEVAVPYDHNSGTARVELGVRSNKDLLDIAYAYIKTSPNVQSL